MNRLPDPLPRSPERFWLERTQWRTVAALVLLLAAVVTSLALASGFWWALHSHPVRSARVSPPAPPAPVATVTIPVISASVVEVYPLTAVHTRGAPIVIRSPGGTIADLPVHIGQQVSAGQMLARLESPRPAVLIARAAAPADPGGAVSREHAEAEKLRRRLEQVRTEIRRVAASGSAAERNSSREASPAPSAAEQVDANVERAQRLLAIAAARRRAVDQQYADHRVSRFQFHLARSRELVAEVELRRAEEEAEAARPAPAAAAVEDRAVAARRNRQQQIARLAREAQAIETRLARVHVRVAGARQRLEPPPPRVDVQTARAPRNGTITAVWAATGAKVPRGAPLVAMELPERPRLRARVGRRALPFLWRGAPVTIRGANGRASTGRVLRVRREPDGSGLVEVVPPRRGEWDRDAVLVPPVSKPPPPTLPAAALIRGSRGTLVWLAVRERVRSGGWVARRCSVRAVPAGRSRVAVLAGLLPGQRVIVAGTHALREGQPVAPVEVGALSAG